MQTLKKRTSEHTPAHAGGGFSFALHPDTVQGFLFARMQHSPMQAFTTCFAVSMQFYTAHAEKQRTGLYSGISCDCTHSIAHDTRPIQQAIALPVPRWSACQRPDALNRYQIPPPHRDAVQVSAAAYYNKVYKRAGRASPAESRRFPRPAAGDLAPGQWSGRAVWHPPPGGAVQQQGARRAAWNHWRLSPHLFSGFRPIANRGQQ